MGSFSGAGQKCTASSRLVVVDSIHDAYVDALIKRMSTLKIGHALEDGGVHGAGGRWQPAAVESGLD